MDAGISTDVAKIVYGCEWMECRVSPPKHDPRGGYHPRLGAVCRERGEPLIGPQAVPAEHCHHPPDEVGGLAVGEVAAIGHERRPRRISAQRGRQEVSIGGGAM